MVDGLKNVESIGECAFANCSSLKEVNFGDRIGYLSNGAFLGCTGFVKLTLPKNITYIGCECFRDCTNLSEIKMEGVREIDHNAFEYCSNIYEISLPETLYHISQNAFSFCVNLKKVEFGNKSVDIDEKAFENTSNLTFVYSSKNSTAYKFAVKNNFLFAQKIINMECRVIKSQKLSVLANSGIFIQYKPYDDKGNIIIAFDKSDRENVIRLIE